MHYSSFKIRKNPFEVFGITPKIVKELDDETLFKLVKSVYRTLQLKYHPDKGGDLQKIKELNLAFELLNLEKSPETFKFYKKKYIERLSRKTLKDKIENLETELRKSIFYRELLKDTFWLYIREIYEFWLNFLKNEVLHLKIFDAVTHSNFSYMRAVKNTIFFHEIFVYPDKVVRKKEKNEQLFTNYIYLGTLKRGLVEPWVLLERAFDEDGYLKHSIKEEVFVKECLVFLNPNPVHGSYVFFYSPQDKKVYLEGIITKANWVKSK